MKKYLKRRDVCPLCGNQRISTLYSVDYQSPDIKGYLTAFYEQQGIFEHEYLEDASYTLCECEECGFLFQQEIPGNELSERIYEHWISPQIALEQELHKLDLKQFRYFSNDLLKVVHSFQKPMREIAVLDFGMGWGTTLQILKSMGCSVFVLEISESRIAYATANGITVLSWEQMKSMQFDYIHTYQVFEHLENPRVTFSELLDCLGRVDTFVSQFPMAVISGKLSNNCVGKQRISTALTIERLTHWSISIVSHTEP